MSIKKIMGADDLRAELARQRISRRELATALGVSYDYVLRILAGSRNAPARRAQIEEYIIKNHETRGVS